MPEWDGLLPPVSCGERPIIDGVRTPVAYSIVLIVKRIATLRHTKSTEGSSLIRLRSRGTFLPLHLNKQLLKVMWKV